MREGCHRKELYHDRWSWLRKYNLNIRLYIWHIHKIIKLLVSHTMSSWILSWVTVTFRSWVQGLQEGKQLQWQVWAQKRKQGCLFPISNNRINWLPEHTWKIGENYHSRTMSSFKLHPGALQIKHPCTGWEERYFVGFGWIMQIRSAFTSAYGYQSDLNHPSICSQSGILLFGLQFSNYCPLQEGLLWWSSCQ